jgi:hypothetical protein
LFVISSTAEAGHVGSRTYPNTPDPVQETVMGAGFAASSVWCRPVALAN